jgi:DNA-binding HxlR family transcriptional regulator
MKSDFGCPVKATANALAGKWKVMILWHLSCGSLRFAEVRDLLPGISEKVLTEQLRQLEADGMVRRTVTPTQPPRVDYALTEAGVELVPVMQSMCDWATRFLGAVPNLPRTRTLAKAG